MISRIARVFLWVLAIGSIAAFAGLSLVRLVSPIEVGNGEGMMLDEAIRIANGQPLYVAPTLRFIPFVYMPMFPAVVAPLVKLFGPALWEGRLVDLIATIGFGVLAVMVVRRETGSTLLGVTGLALYLMGHGLTRGGYDVVRPDPLMLLLAMAALAALRWSETARGAAIAGALSGLAFFAKQHGVLFTGGALAYLFFHERRRLAPFALAALVVIGGGYGLLALWLGPWFDFYVRDVPSHWSQFSRGRVIQYFGEILFGKLGGFTIPVALAVAMPDTVKRGREWLWYWMAVAGVGTGLVATLDPYAYYHVLMPTVAALSVAGPVALQRIAQRLSPARTEPVSAICLVLAVQFVPLLYPMHVLVPRPGGAEAHRDIVAQLRAIEGPVLLPYHGYYTTVAGKGMGMTVLPLDDILRAHGNGLLRRDPHYFDRMFDSLRAGPGRPVIVSDTVFTKAGDASTALWSSLEGPYRRAGSLGDLSERLRPLAGARNAPTWIYVPVDTGIVRSGPLGERGAAAVLVAPAAAGATPPVTPPAR